MPISISINVDKIDKHKLYQGKKGRYLNLMLWESEGTEAEEYGDYIVKQKGEKGDKMPILGNGKILRDQQNNKPRKNHNEPQYNDDPGSPF